jgi:hypothetical protein
VQGTELWAGVDAEVLGERGLQTAIGIQRIGLPSADVVHSGSR